jgi:hypothetical protein
MDPRPLWQALAVTAVRLLVVGLIAVGVSGLLAGGMGLVFGRSFVSGDPAGVTYTADRCAGFFEYSPGAHTCEEAATRHHFGEVVQYRIAAGVLGILVLGGYLWLRRRPGWNDTSPLPVGFASTVGATLFGAAAAALFAESLNLLVIGGSNGAGEYLSGGLVALVVAAAFGWSLYRTLMRRATPSSVS